jgi:GAF domain-containing protein
MPPGGSVGRYVLDYDVTPDNGGIRMSAWAGIPEEALEPLMFLKFGQALCGTSAVSRKPVIVERLQSSTDPKASRMQAVGSTAYACFPLIVGDRLLGTLAFASHRVRSRRPGTAGPSQLCGHGGRAPAPAT